MFFFLLYQFISLMNYYYENEIGVFLERFYFNVVRSILTTLFCSRSCVYYNYKRRPNAVIRWLQIFEAFGKE